MEIRRVPSPASSACISATVCAAGVLETADDPPDGIRPIKRADAPFSLSMSAAPVRVGAESPDAFRRCPRRERHDCHRSTVGPANPEPVGVSSTQARASSNDPWEKSSRRTTSQVPSATVRMHGFAVKTAAQRGDDEGHRGSGVPARGKAGVPRPPVRAGRPPRLRRQRRRRRRGGAERRRVETRPSPDGRHMGTDPRGRGTPSARGVARSSRSHS